MLELFEASPDEERAMMLRNEVNYRLLSGMEHLLEACDSAKIGTSKQQELIYSCTSGSKLSGMLHMLHDRLLNAIKNGSKNDVKAIIATISEYSYNSQDVRVIYWHDTTYSAGIYDLYFDACNNGFMNTYGVNFDGEALNAIEIEHSKANAELALNRFNVATPNLYNEFNVFASDIMLIHSPTMNAASSISSLGIIRMSQLREHQIWTRYFENIVHEAAHQYLNNLWYLDPIILNEGEQSYNSPLRKEKRPLSGIYHALFVLARTIRALKTLKQSDEFDDKIDFFETAYNNKGNNASFIEKFEDCWQLIEKNAKLTEIGKKLMHSSREYAFD